MHRPALKTYLAVLGIGLLLSGSFRTMKAEAHVEEGKMPDPVAEMEYRILLEFKPEDNPTRNLLAMVLLRQKKLDEAEKEFREVISRDAMNFDALDGLGVVLLQRKGRTAEALHLLMTAAAQRPNDILVHLHLGRAMAMAGRTGEARIALQDGLKLLTGLDSAEALKQKAEFETALKSLPQQGSGLKPD